MRALLIACTLIATSISTLAVAAPKVHLPGIKPGTNPGMSPGIKPGIKPGARPPSVKVDVDFDLSGFESVVSVEPVKGGKFLTVARSKPTSAQGKTWTGDLVFRVTDHAAAALNQSFGQASVSPAPDEPGLLVPVDASLDQAGAVFVGYFTDSLAERQNLRIAKLQPVQGQAPVNTPAFSVVSRDQARGRSIVPDEKGGVFVRGFTWNAAFDVKVVVPYTRRYSATGVLTWEKLGPELPQMSASESESRPATLLGVADGNGGLFEVQNLPGVTAANNFDAAADRAWIRHRSADGSVAYERAVSSGGKGVARSKPTPGAVQQILLAGDGNPVLVFRANGDDAHRKLVHIGATGQSRLVTTFSDEDFVLQAANGDIVVMSPPATAGSHYTFRRYGIAGGNFGPLATTTTPDIPVEQSVWSEEPPQVSLSANGVVVVASHDKVAGRPSIAAMTLDGRVLGHAKSPRGADMIVNDGNRFFGYVRTAAGGWAYKGGAIDLGSSIAQPAAAPH